MKIGIYGGTFNPIHKGHVHFAKTALKELELDKVILIPDNIPPHKENMGIAPSEYRLQMCRLAVEDEEKIEVSDMEIKRHGISYTVDTLKEIKEADPDAELFLLTGTDMFLTIDKWKSAEEIMTLATAVGAPRIKEDLPRLLEKEKEMTCKGLKCKVIPLIPIETSSTEIRNGYEDGLDKRVLSYIEQNALYGCPLKFNVDLDKIKEKVKGMLSPFRFQHSLNVADEAITLGRINNCDLTLCYIAGLLHDSLKEISKEEMLKILKDTDIICDKAFLMSPKIWHGYAASICLGKNFGIYSEDIKEAVAYHSTAKDGMSLLARIIYMADLLSIERNYPGVSELREKTHNDLEAGLLEALQFSITSLTNEGKPLLSSTVNAYNELVMKEE